MMLIGASSSGSASPIPASVRTSCSSFAWKCLIPISLANILVTAVLKVVF